MMTTTAVVQSINSNECIAGKLLNTPQRSPLNHSERQNSDGFGNETENSNLLKRSSLSPTPITLIGSTNNTYSSSPDFTSGDNSR